MLLEGTKEVRKGTPPPMGPRKRKAPPKGWEGDCPGRDSGSEGEKAHHAKVEEELKAHLKHRTFVFVHHFSGAKDVLGEAVMAEAKEQGVRVTVVSVDTHLEGGVGRAALDGDLSKDRPYLDHLKLAKDGCVDLYHAGFPCTTFSRQIQGEPRNALPRQGQDPPLRETLKL